MSVLKSLVVQSQLNCFSFQNKSGSTRRRNQAAKEAAAKEAAAKEAAAKEAAAQEAAAKEAAAKEAAAKEAAAKEAAAKEAAAKEASAQEAAASSARSKWHKGFDMLAEQGLLSDTRVDQQCISEVPKAKFKFVLSLSSACDTEVD